MNVVRSRTSLESALVDKPWALTGVLLTMADAHDAGGRPLGERRASADAKRGVPFELKACPYHDERHGRSMNASALAPTIRHYAAVASAVASLHAALPPGPPSWRRMLVAVMDRLAAPALFLLAARSPDARVPEDVSAGHKLAAGYFGALQQLLRHEVQSPAERREASPERFLEFVHERGSLIGASEVCAGAPHSIERLTEVFVTGGADRGTPAEERRVRVATLLSAQVVVGLVWQLFDEAIERRLLVEPDAAGVLAPKTQYLRQRMQARLDALAERAPVRLTELGAGLPDEVGDSALGRLLAEGGVPATREDDLAALESLLATSDVAIVHAAESARDATRRSLAVLLGVYRAFVSAHFRIESHIRAALDYPPAVGMKLNALLLPTPRSLEWLEIFTGHRLQCVPGDPPELALRNHHRVVPLG